MIHQPQQHTKRVVFEDQEIICPLCGQRFLKGEKTLCAKCPFHYGTCAFEKCPDCGYDVPQTQHSQVVKFFCWLEKYFKEHRS